MTCEPARLALINLNWEVSCDCGTLVIVHAENWLSALGKALDFLGRSWRPASVRSEKLPSGGVWVGDGAGDRWYAVEPAGCEAPAWGRPWPLSVDPDTEEILEAEEADEVEDEEEEEEVLEFSIHEVFLESNSCI